MKQVLVLAAVALLLAGCGSDAPVVSSSESFHIAEVEAVGIPPGDGSVEQLHDLRTKTRAMAAYIPATDNPRLLRLRILSFHKKNPGMSFLVGDSNNMDVSAEVVSMDGSAVMGRFQVNVANDMVLNGVVGAAIAASKTDVEVQRELNTKAASTILEKIYGKKLWKSWTKKH